MFKLESYQQLKTVLDISGVKYVAIDLNDHYFVIAQMGPAVFKYMLLKSSPPTQNQSDFENNYATHNGLPLGSATELHNIGTAGDRLKVDSMFSPVEPSKVVVDWSNNKIDLPRQSIGYAEVYRHDGTGSLYGFTMDFNSDNIFVKLTIDDNQIFEINFAGIEEMNIGTKTGRWVNWSSATNVLVFDPYGPISFSSSVVIEAKANQETSAYDMSRYMVDISKG